MEEFSFPFTPYEVQLNLMREIKHCIEKEQVGIFESPTGTGKSLSVLCATMTWLEEFEKNMEDSLLRKSRIVEEVDNEDWIAAHRKKLELRSIKDEAYEKLKVLEKVKEKLQDARDGLIKKNKRRFCESTVSEDPIATASDCDPPENYGSDDEFESNSEEPLEVVKIFYASRTHSQLDQLLDELKKTRFFPRVVTAVSRQTLCVNEGVRRLKHSHLINEKCMELRRTCKSEGKRVKLEGKTSSIVEKQVSSKCPYYRNDAIEELSNEILASTLLRPNEVVERGKQLLACPYFSTRLSLPLCQLVLLPYQKHLKANNDMLFPVLLHASTRAAWGIHLKGNVLVLDEAHNVLETIGSLYSSEVTSVSTTLALSLVREYIDTYRSKLKSKNLMYMRQLLAVVAAMDQFLRKGSNTSEEVLTIQGVIIALRLTDVNFYKLVHYLDATDMCRKFHGFYIRSMNPKVSISQSSAVRGGIAKLMEAKITETKTPLVDDKARNFPSPLFTIKQFLEAMSNRCEDGRVIVDRKGNTAKFRFILLNPATRLLEAVNEARATILIGGTMEPADLLVDCLSKAVKNGIRRFSCSHVINDDQLLALSLGFHVRNQKFTLTYETRNNVDLVKSVAETVMLLAREVPNGSVAFFTSYDFMSHFLSIVEKFKIIQQCNMKKKVFVESRESSEEVWDRFVAASRTSEGAILFAVAGGKLSEGINFSDELGRAVFMIGLPYPNRSNVELKEKMAYMDTRVQCGGNQLYQSLCMHAVNQAIGRAIRHRKDYAAVYLLDYRYTRQEVISRLPSWISKTLKCPDSFAEALRSTKAFFQSKTH